MQRRSSRVGLRVIAEETNLSMTTVSRVLRERGEIAQETRDRVLEAAKRLRYRPNMLVHGIRTGQTMTVGVLVPPYDSYWTKVLYGIHDELGVHDYVFINAWCTPEGNGDSYSSLLLKQLHRLIDRRVDGIILWAHLAPLYDKAVVEELEDREVPVVTIDHELPFADSVETDEKVGASLVADHLLKFGHRRVAHLAWDQSYKWAQLRCSFFEKEITDNGGTCIVRSTDNDSQVADLTRELIAQKPRPTAIYACSDRVAKIVCSTVNEIGLQIPRDISVIGFADLEFSQWMQPSLTTVRQDGLETGKTAAQLLVRRAEESYDSTNPKRLCIPCELVKRDSVGPARRTT